MSRLGRYDLGFDEEEPDCTSVYQLNNTTVYQVVFYTRIGGYFFKFISERPPVMNANCNCLISTDKFLLHEMVEAIHDLMEPMRFGKAMMN